MSKKFKLLSSQFISGVIFTLSLSTGSKIYAYGDVGHLAVCQIAYENLTATAKQKLDSILGGRNFARQCGWPDQVKKLKTASVNWTSTAGLHFVNFEDNQSWGSPDGYKPTDAKLYKTGDMVHGILRAYDVLTSKGQSVPIQQQMCHLRFLGHLAGDSHQPLHIGRGSDFGGNAKYSRFLDLVNFNIKSIMLDSNNVDGCIEHGDDPLKSDNSGCAVLNTINLSPVGLHAQWDDLFIDMKIAKLKLRHPLDIAPNSNDTVEGGVQNFVDSLMQRVSQDKKLEIELMASKGDDFLKWVEISKRYRPTAYDASPFAMDDMPTNVSYAQHAAATQKYIADMTTKFNMVSFANFDSTFNRIAGKLDKEKEEIEDYYGKRIDLIELQLLRGGFHLAGMLNRIFDPDFINQNAAFQSRQEFFDARLNELRQRIKLRRAAYEAANPAETPKPFMTMCDKI